MINAQDAYLNMINHGKREPVTRLSTIAEMVRVSSTLGAERIEVFIKTRDASKFKQKLRSLGYLIDEVHARTLPDEVLITINWARAEFVGETIREIE